jgi:protein involved in sex pheromone biosynthesis
MKKRAIFALLAYIAVLAGCMTTMTDEERARQARAEEERRWKAINTGH